jgi:signal transduction histidine kinase
MEQGSLNEATLRQLIEAGRGLVSQLELEPLLHRLLEVAQDLTGARYAALGILDGDRRELERFLTAGIDATAHAAIGDLPRGRGVLGVLISDPRPLRLPRVGDHPKSYGFPPGHPEMNSVLGVPVIIRGEAWGNLYLTEKHGGAAFTDADEDAAVVLAAWAAIAVENASLYEKAEERRTELERVVEGLRATTEIARAVGGETDLARVLELIAKRGRALVHARSLVIYLDAAGGLESAAAAGDLDRHSAPAYPEQLGDGSTLLVPMAFRGSSIGVLAAFERTRGGPAFTPEDENLLRSFAASAATAVHTAQSVAADRLRHSLEAAEQERRRWARELHDETLQGLAALKVMLETAGGRSGEDALRAAVAHTTVQLDDQIRALRSLITELRPAALDELGLGAAIESLAERLATVEGIAVELDLDSEETLGRLPAELETTIYRLVQEALTNVAKHARAERAWVKVGRGTGSVEVAVRDDGMGFVPDAPGGGFGIVGMHERVAMAGGTLEIASSPGGGSSLSASLPLLAGDQPSSRSWSRA